MRAFATTALVGVSVLALAAPALAQQVASDAPDAAVADIIVTAQKRSERLQDVPVAVSVISGATLQNRGSLNLENAQYLVPSLNFQKSGVAINQSLFLRGVGTSTFSIAGEPSVSTVVDGVVFSRAGEAFSDLVDIERIEVLRGPQGTLFGKNASAGVVNIITKRPGDEFGGSVDASWFEGNEFRLRGSVDVPMGEKISSRFTGFYSKYDGNIYNEAVDRDVNGYERYGFRGVVEARPSEFVTLTLIGDWRKADDDCCVLVVAAPPLTGAGAVNTAALAFIQPAIPPLQGSDTRRINQNTVNRNEETSWGLSLQADAELGGQLLTSITAYREFDNSEVRDGDWTSQPYIGVPQISDVGPQEGKTFSQELRIASMGSNVIDYVAGAYFSSAKTTRTFTRSVIQCAAATPPAPTVLTPCTSPLAAAPTFPGATAYFGSDFTNFALFGQATWNVSDALRVIGGLRYTIDQLDVFHSRQTVLAGPGVQGSGPTVNGVLATRANPWNGKATNENLSGKAAVQFDLSDTSMVYGSYARGYKGPAFNVFFNLQAVGTGVVEAESADAFEIGLKNTLFDGTVVLNIAGFYAKYKNFQANNPDIVSGVVVTRFTNAGDVSTRGVELDFVWRPSSDFGISGGVAYTDAHVDQFKLPPGGNPNDVIPSGTPLAFAPKWKGSLAADYRLGLSDNLDLLFGLQGSVQSSQLAIFSPNPIVRENGTIDGYALVDASVGLGDSEDRYRVTFHVRNLFDQSFPAAMETGGPGGTYLYRIPREADRYIGVSGRFNF
jgi:iron complex outermembrane receptor protein